MWRELLRSGAMILCVVEDHERPRQNRVVSFGNSVFVTDRFAEEASTTLPPYLSGQVAGMWLRGETPVLDGDAVRRANARPGLRAFLWQYGWARHGERPEDLPLIMAKLANSFVPFHRGYRLKEVLVERFGEHSLQIALAQGMYLRTDYAWFYEGRGWRRPPPDERPYLVGTTREEAFMHVAASTVGSVFVYAEPRFLFKAGEQELLARALAGYTDEELAGALNLSLPGVKKRWNALYARVSVVDPALTEGAPPGPRRSAEKRRRLLYYLRDHPEELRPLARPGRV